MASGNSGAGLSSAGRGKDASSPRLDQAQTVAMSGSFREYWASLSSQPGVVTASVQAFAREQGLYYPVSFASEGSSQIGGNVATNAVVIVSDHASRSRPVHIEAVTIIVI